MPTSRLEFVPLDQLNSSQEGMTSSVRRAAVNGDASASRGPEGPSSLQILLNGASPRGASKESIRLGASFFLFGLLNNSLYVVILAAALELLPQGVPTGVVAFANIFPALLAKAFWPYVLRGRVRYTRRVWSCTVISFAGMVIIALFPSLFLRLLGISLASFSSGLGELTFLQLSTTYKSAAGAGVGWFASGTGAAGLVGALAWWLVRPLGVKLGLGILSFLPFLMAGAYLLILPAPEAIASSSSAGYTAVPTTEDEARAPTASRSSYEHEEPPLADAQGELPLLKGGIAGVKISFKDKLALLRPMLLPYIIPLVLVYLFEYTINQGVAPTLLFPVPTSKQHPLLALLIKKLSDYYPLYQLTYQTFVFLSRSSVSLLRLPAIPKEYLSVPALLQGGILILLITEALYAWFRESIASPLVVVLICVEGLAGGAAYVSVFYQIGTDRSSSSRFKSSSIRAPSAPHDGAEVEDGDQDQEEEEDGEGEEELDPTVAARRAQEHEFRIGCVGVGDSLGILVASLIAMPLELALCNAQVSRGRDLCKHV